MRTGNLAIVVKELVKSGDLAAVCEIATDQVIIGFFESQYGLICLENNSGEPDLFDENAVTILGKVVGYALPEKNNNDYYEVQTIKLKN